MTAHLLHLTAMDEGMPTWDLTCELPDMCVHVEDGRCSLVEWFDNVGGELIVDDGEDPFPADPHFPVPVRARQLRHRSTADHRYNQWDDDGPQIVYDPPF